MLALALAACSTQLAPVSDARSPISPKSFWEGLPPPSSSPHARGTVALRPPLEGRVPIPGGSFMMGSTEDDLKQLGALCQQGPLGALCQDEHVQLRLRLEMPAHAVTVSPFEIDRTEVTGGAYARCIAAAMCPATSPSGEAPRVDHPELPVTSVDWDAARSFCAWAGGRLPTEAEWEYAARGAEGRRFPWGDVYNGFLCNHGSLIRDDLPRDPMDASDGFAGLAPVGSFLDGATPLGVLDLAGNAAEWVADFYEPDPRNLGYDPASQVNPKGPKFGSLHIVRGGSFLDGAVWMRAAARYANVGPSPAVGFRCVADVR